MPKEVNMRDSITNAREWVCK